MIRFPARPMATLWPVILAVATLGPIGPGPLAQTHHWIRTNPGGGGAIATVGATASGTILAASDLSGIYRSFDGGLSWDVLGANQGLLSTHISALGFHPTDGNTFFAGTYIGAYKTTDGGEHFTLVFPASGDTIPYSYIESIAIAPSNPAVGYLTHHPGPDTFGTVYRTADGGDTWGPVPGSDLPDSLRLVKLLVHPTDPDLVYLLTGKSRWGCSPARLYRSTNGGVHWTRVAAGLGDILDMDPHPTDPGIVFVSTFASTFVDVPSCQATDMDTYAGDDEFAGAFYRSTDGGATFSPLSDKTGIISVDPTDPDIIRLVEILFPYDWHDDAGTWETLDGGLTWTHTGPVTGWSKGYTTNQYFAFTRSFNGLTKTLTKDPFHPDRMYASFGQWAWASSDAGRTVNNASTREVAPDHWRSTGLENIDGTSLALTAADPDIIYMGGYDIGFWYSTDHGASWTRSLPDYNVYPEYVWDLGVGPVDPHQAVREAGANVFSILADPQRPSVVWATFSRDQYSSDFEGLAAVTGLFRSTAGGENWQQVSAGLPAGNSAIMMYGLSLDPHSPVEGRTLFMTVKGDVYRSVDDGLSWSLVLAEGGMICTAVDNFDGNLVYAAGRDGVFRSTDGGDTWSDLGHGELGHVHANIRSDLIPTWIEWSAPEPIYPWEGVFDLRTDPVTPGRVYAAVLGPGKGLYRSNDAGDNWTRLVTDDHMRFVAVAPQNPDIIYASSSQSYDSGGFGNSLGILYSTDGGTVWQDANDGMAWNYGGRVAVGAGPHPDVWVFVPGTGLQFSPVPALAASPVPGPEAAQTLLRNAPNPFNPTTTITYTLARSGPVELKVYDAGGREVATLVRGHRQAGTHTLSFDGSRLSSGVYLAELRDGTGLIRTSKMTLIK